MKTIFKTEYIDDYLKFNKITMKEFCLQSQLNYNVVKRMNHNKNCRLSTLIKRAKFLKVQVCDLLNKDGMEDFFA